MKTISKPTLIGLVLLAATTVLITACSEETPLAPTVETSQDDGFFDKSLEIIFESGGAPPADLATVSLGADQLTFWPYTGTTYDGTPVDPINVVFAGQADPLQIRAALLALDGDRTAFGMPDIPPFNQSWLDALGGDVQTTCAPDGNGWAGSVIQLTLGDYGPLRAHLRLFRTGAELGDGVWTLGGAHFEMQIPGTTDHQVLSWEIAEQIVIVDMMRAGLLDADVPMLPTGLINDAPSFRSIPVVIYNLLPPELVDLIDGPPQPVTEDVPLDSDGQGTIFNLATAAPVVTDDYTATTTVQFEQMVPRPFCSEGPGDYLYVTGPVDFTLNVRVNGNQHFSSRADYSGQIMAQPFDLSSGEPVPVGEPFLAKVSGRQQGSMSPHNSNILAIDSRLTREADGPQRFVEQLHVPQFGLKTYRSQTRCIDE